MIHIPFCICVEQTFQFGEEHNSKASTVVFRREGSSGYKVIIHNLAGTVIDCLDALPNGITPNKLMAAKFYDKHSRDVDKKVRGCTQICIWVASDTT